MFLNFSNFAKILLKFAEILQKIWHNFEVAELCKGVHCVDLGESFQTHNFLQNFVSIQPRTSPVKFARPLAVQTLAYQVEGTRSRPAGRG